MVEIDMTDELWQGSKGSMTRPPHTAEGRSSIRKHHEDMNLCGSGFLDVVKDRPVGWRPV
jgi:hypothetical protein